MNIQNYFVPSVLQGDKIYHWTGCVLYTSISVGTNVNELYPIS